MEERLKVVVRGLIEVLVALTIMHNSLTDSYTTIYCIVIYILASVRSVYWEQFDILFFVFVLTYMT